MSRVVLSFLGLVWICSCTHSPDISDPPTGGPVDFQSAWSPAESLIAYTHAAQTIDELARGQFQIYIYNAYTGDTTFVGAGMQPSWSPRGDTLLFAQAGQLILYDVATGLSATVPLSGPCANPSWSPSGAQIAFETNQGDPLGARAIWVAQSDGTDARDISTHGTGEWLAPSWSPSGTAIVHSRFVLGTQASELFIMAAGGTTIRRLTNDDATDQDPAWSPGGNEVAWTRVNASGAFGVYVQDTSSAGRRLVFADSRDPSWHPSGDSLAFSRSSTSGRGLVLWIGSGDGSSARQVTR